MKSEGRSTATHNPEKPSCASDGIAEFVLASGTSIVATWSALGVSHTTPPCAGVSERVSWAVYRYQPDGSGLIYSSNVGYLDRGHQTLTIDPELPVGCAVVFVAHDSYGNPSALTAEQMVATRSSRGEPFRDQRHDMSGLVYRGTYNCATPSDSPTDPPSASPTTGPTVSPTS
jgi:hypothetical protein